MSLHDLPLLEIFIQLHKAGLPLGLDEYQLLLRSLQGGYGISDREALKRLCRTLWVKSAEEDRLLDYHFEQLMPQQLTIEAGSETFSTPEVSETPINAPTSQPTASKLETLSTSDVEPSTSETTDTSEITTRAEDEVYIAQTVLQTFSNDDEILPYNYISADEYFPITRRQMKQSWRYLRHPIRQGPAVEVDIEATVNEVGRKGMLFSPVLVPRRINRAELLLLIDQGGSMVPFHILSQRLLDTALRGGRLGKAHIYYFHNCPLEYLYHDPTYQEYEQIDDLLQSLSHQTTALIFSDAGAARGGFSEERINLTVAFLAQCRQHIRYMAWLNPMPASRWPHTTAGEVSRFIPMFDLSRQGLDSAISVLRGRLSRYAQVEVPIV